MWNIYTPEGKETPKLFNSSKKLKLQLLLCNHIL